MKKITNNTPAEWQQNPDNVTTKTVQFWRHGVMISAMVSLENARQAIRDGSAFVISTQAIGALTNGKYDS